MGSSWDNRILDTRAERQGHSQEAESGNLNAFREPGLPIGSAVAAMINRWEREKTIAPSAYSQSICLFFWIPAGNSISFRALSEPTAKTELPSSLNKAPE